MKNIMEEYKPVLKSMAEAGEEGDMNVLFDKLIYMARKSTGMITGGDDYKGIPEDFDYENFLKNLD